MRQIDDTLERQRGERRERGEQRGTERENACWKIIENQHA